MIVKVQRSVTGPPGILVYDKPRESIEDGMIVDTHIIFISEPMSLGRIHTLLGDDLKGYFEATMTEGGQVVIGRRVPDEEW